MRLKTHLSNTNLNEPFQSAYKACHSTETALIRVKNDIMLAVDGKKAVVELISLKTSSRTLRSSDQLTLNTPVARLKSYGDS